MKNPNAAQQLRLDFDLATPETSAQMCPRCGDSKAQEPEAFPVFDEVADFSLYLRAGVEVLRAEGQTDDQIAKWLVDPSGKAFKSLAAAYRQMRLQMRQEGCA